LVISSAFSAVEEILVGKRGSKLTAMMSSTNSPDLNDQNEMNVEQAKMTSCILITVGCI
jgi:hypothetical protein